MMHLTGPKSTAPAGNVPLRITFAVTQTGPDAAAGDLFTAISHPVVLAGVTNCIEITFASTCAVAGTDSVVPIDPCSFITLAHLVIDEKIITQLIGA
ncbi:MAG: hypothetical protein K9K38_19160 [Rhodoferax sp.]|nr:hypothetical protein [Rhodoferax sp.]